jgi:hypothetical protein
MVSILLADWANFYVITGTAAAGLTGLTFVCIALAADTRRVSVVGLRAFVTPTIVHFCAVLALSAFLSVPHLTAMSLCVGFGVAGIAGVSYVGVVAARMNLAANNYVPVLEDWLGNAILPAIAYGVPLVMAFTVGQHPQASLYGVAAVLLLLLFIGIHNAWDVAVWNTTNKTQDNR